ncbi:MAG: hypothetical protein [Wendovervirus sonii]|uniref:Uncharacterized protein n=1 Tax=phage Lak_Megaphage_Sonny TaxID=3109229 RepID=A0ABZ0Z3D3_9CAUD|nr:MAG: hypothetical protein [phage Lak_Megaphage_Sonny]
MGEKKEIEVIEPQYGFWEVCVEIATEDDNGKIKKVKEIHLVDDVTAGSVEKKVAEEMDGTMWEWKIVSVKQSKIQIVY